MVQRRDKALGFFAGSYRVRVNNSDTTAEVVAGEIRECETGTLTVAGEGSEYYYVLDKTGNQLNYNSLNKPYPFFPPDTR